MSSGQRRGRWSGVPVRDRPALRRDDLITAGIELLGSPGGPNLTVRAACRAAGLTERYFYESFTDRDDYVAAIYDEVGSAAMASSRPATSATTFSRYGPGAPNSTSRPTTIAFSG